MLTLFDCDGVLVDSEILASTVICDVLREVGYESTPEELSERFAGITTEGIFKLVGEEIGRPVPQSAIESTKHGIDEKLRHELKPIPGVQEMLDAIEGPRCICSNSRAYRLEISLKRTELWDRFRPYVFSAQEVGTKRGKPAPDIYLYGAEQFGVDPADGIVVEDSITGIAAGVAAGMRVIGFVGGSHTWPGHADMLTEAGAITVVRRLADIPPTIEALRRWRPAI
jgi:HAD superfamily hydrolase (TIGR01509 family)